MKFRAKRYSMENEVEISNLRKPAFGHCKLFWILLLPRLIHGLNTEHLHVGTLYLRTKRRERCNEEEHEVGGNYPIPGENTEKESKERRCCFTLETTKELAVSQVSPSLKNKTESSSFHLRRAKKIPWNLEVVSFSPSSPKSVVRDIHSHGGELSSNIVCQRFGNEIWLQKLFWNF